MKAPRISIATLMGCVLVSAVGIAALRYSSSLWAGIMLMLTLGLLAIALLGVIYHRGARQAGWAGFLVFAGGYIALAFGPWFVTEIRPWLPTTVLLTEAFRRIEPTEERFALTQTYTKLKTARVRQLLAVEPPTQPERLAASLSLRLNTVSSPVRLWLTSSAESEYFQRVGHCLVGCLLGLLGTFIARGFHASGQRDAALS